MKKTIGLICSAVFMMTALTGCGGEFNPSSKISVISREDGSGTRGAFTEIFKIEQKDESGNKVDRTTIDAGITNSTSVMMTDVAGNIHAIGYISLGSLNDTVKAIKIDGAEASAENIKNKTYSASRPFNIATSSDVSDAAKDFISFIVSKEGQAVVEANGYIPLDASESYSGGAKGKITVAGSSSVTPVMEKLKEAYIKLNSEASVEIQQSDSTTGMTSVIDGICDIGMASRELKDSELEKGITPTVIAIDGIAVIVNKESLVDGLTSEQIEKIYIGEAKIWSDVYSG